jgi:hypothetical protein
LPPSVFLNALELGVVAGDLLQLLRVLRQPELHDLVAVVEIADASDVVVVRVRDREHVEALAAVVAVREDVVEQLEQVDALAGAAVDVDQHVAVAGNLDQSRVAVPDVDEGDLEVSHSVPFWQPFRPPGQRCRLDDGAVRRWRNGQAASSAVGTRPWPRESNGCRVPASEIGVVSDELVRLAPVAGEADEDVPGAVTRARPT